MLNPYLVSGVPTAPPGPQSHPDGLYSNEAAGADPHDFARWWQFNGESMPGYVKRCETFVKNTRKKCLQLCDDDGDAFDKGLRELLADVYEWVSKNRRVAFALENIMPEMSDDEQRRFQNEIALYRRAEAGCRLVKNAKEILQEVENTSDEVEKKLLLTSVSRAIVKWL